MYLADPFLFIELLSFPNTAVEEQRIRGIRGIRGILDIRMAEDPGAVANGCRMLRERHTIFVITRQTTCPLPGSTVGSLSGYYV